MNEPLEPPHDPTPSSPDTLPPQDEAAEESPDYDYDTEERDDTVIASALKKSLAVFGIAAVLIAGVVVAQGFLGEVEELATERAPLEVPEVPKRPDAEIPQVTFTDITAEAGIDFVHENGAYGDKLLPETMGGGCAFLDFDSDGDQDLLLVNSKRWDWDTRPKPKQPAHMALYENDGSGHFSNVTAQWKLDVSLYGMGAAVGDFDNDGHPDLFISAVGHNRLFRNTGKRFVDVTEAARVAESVLSSGESGKPSQRTCWRGPKRGAVPRTAMLRNQKMRLVSLGQNRSGRPSASQSPSTG